MRCASAVCCVLVACVGNTAPPAFLPPPVKAQATAYGGWIELRLGQEPGDGELLAVTADSVWLLTREGGLAIATANVTQGKLTAYQAPIDHVAGWTALGVLSTAANGLFLIFTAPAWIITGTVAGSNTSNEPVRRVPPLAWTDLAPYARFPQGMPAGVSVESLKLPTVPR